MSISSNSSEIEPTPLLRKTGTLIAKNISALSEQIFLHHFNEKLLDVWVISRPEPAELIELKQRFSVPLLKLLSNYLIHQNEAILSVYLDERLRYAPHKMPFEQRVPFHQELIFKDIEVIAELLPSTERELISQLLLDLHQSLISTDENLQLIKVLAVGDCLMNEIRVFAPSAGYKKQLLTDFQCSYFSANQSKGLSADEIIKKANQNSIDLIAFSFFSFEALPGYSQLLLSCHKMTQQDIDNGVNTLVAAASGLLQNLREVLQQPFIVHNASGLPLNRIQKVIGIPALSSKQKRLIHTLYEEIQHLVEVTDNCILLDEFSISQKQGLKQCAKNVVSQRRYKGMFHTSHFGRYLADEYSLITSAYANLAKTKLLLIDFDNTLWEGVMADGEVIQHKDRQAKLLELKSAGILLAAVSKNSLENIRWDEMLLSPDDFVALKINWNPKAQSIKELASELNLGISSFVFLDDSPQERAQIETAIPEVHSLDPNIAETWQQLMHMLSFPNTQQTEEAKQRTELYQKQAKRAALREESVDYPSMMAALELKASFYPATSKHLTRIYELVGRTNQFNTTTKRYSKKDLSEMLNNPEFNIVLADFGDKYGSMGIVGIVILRKTSENHLEIDTFIMSCRAMGFGLETELLHHIAYIAEELSVKKMVGYFKGTDRNAPCSKLYQDAGFSEESQGRWELERERFLGLKSVDWIDVEEKNKSKKNN